MTHDRTPLWLNADLERELRRLATDSGTPLSELVEEALRDFMFRNVESDGGEPSGNARGGPAGPAGEGECAPCVERRACCRRKITVPAVIHTMDQDGRTGRYRVAEVRDISSSGIGLRFENEEQIRVGRDFEILFQLAERSSPVRMACRACRKVLDGAGVVIGAVFSEPFTGLDQEFPALA